MSAHRSWVRTRRAASLALTTILIFAANAGQAQEDPPPKILLKGRIIGGQHLLNPVWNEAKDPKNHRYTFRVPSATVNPAARVLRAYLPRELAIAAIAQEPVQPSSVPVNVHLSGGRTTPSTVVITVGQNVQFHNHDPFPHKLYDTAGVSGGMGPESTAAGKQRTWRPPAAGVYELRDKLIPSVRSWIVVEPKAAAMGSPNRKNEFVVPQLPPGSYQLQAYFAGKPVGTPVPVVVRPAPAIQPVGPALNLGTAASQ